MTPSLFVAGRHAADDAQQLMRHFGVHAVSEAAARVDTSRDRGNLSGFCHWRQIERLIAAMIDPQGPVTLH